MPYRSHARSYTMPVQQRDAIESPGAWLTTVPSRLCLTAHPNYILAGETDEGLVHRRSHGGKRRTSPMPSAPHWA